MSTPLAKSDLTSAETEAGSSGLPRHVAIIMDGNGRWAKKRRLPRTAGHKKGADAVRRTVETAAKAGIEYLTLFAFSSENWQRPQEEISELMGLLRQFIKSELKSLHANNVRVQTIGDSSRFSPDIQELLAHAKLKTAQNTGLCLNVALNYGARQEIVAAVRRLAAEVADGARSLDSLDEAAVSQALFTCDLPDPDLIIRTSGEQRLSNFLLWQAAYSELYFVDKYWPDFKAEDLLAAIDEFSSRERRYGATLA